ncbi:MAG: DUF5666 domain-containing protein [Minisyncoccota bacterium]
MKIYKLFISLGVLFSLFFGIVASAQSPFSDSDFDITKPKPEIYIDKTGDISIVGAKVMQFVSNVIYVRVIWQNSFMRLTIKTDQSTNIVRKFGETIKLSDIAVGDYLGIEGTLESNSDSLSLLATKIKNLSDQKQQNNFTGTIYSIDASNKLTLKTAGGDLVKLNLSSTTEISLGSRIVDFWHLKVGDKIISTSGTYNYADKNFQVDKMRVYIDMNIFKPKNFKGVLKTISEKTLPTSIVVTINSKDYTVKLSSATQIINNKRKNIVLSRFVEGDSIVLYGAIQESDIPIIDNVEIIRNASL